MRRLLRGGMVMTLASMAWRNRASIQQAVRSQSRRRPAGARR